MNYLGIYFGPKTISIIEAKGKKMLTNIEIPHAAGAGAEFEEKAPAETKNIETVALFKNELRKNNIESGEATLCLSGRDLIIRTFELPSLPREELQNAVNFEAKKYIPFKVEDLISDFQIEVDKASRINQILFVGIKKDVLEKYISILSELNIKFKDIEYSGFSMLRCLRLAGVSEKGVIGIVNADPAGEDEINFTVTENGFPLFSRDITLGGAVAALGGFEKPAEPETAAALEKLKTEIKVSLDYYNRKFPSKSIKKIFFLSNPDHRSEIETFMMDLGISAHYIDIMRIIGKNLAYSSGFVKGYTASLSRLIKSKIKVNLLTVKARVKPSKEKVVQLDLLALLQGARLDYRAAGLGVLICALGFGLGFYSIQVAREDLNRTIAMRSQVSTVSPESSYEELLAASTKYKNQIGNLDTLIKKQVYVTGSLNAIPQAISPGVWLTSFSFNKQEKAKAEVTLSGMAYLGNSEKEFAAVNLFVANLKKDPNFALFKDISVTSLSNGKFGEESVTNFNIVCRKN